MICSFYFVWVVILLVRIVRDSFAHIFNFRTSVLSRLLCTLSLIVQFSMSVCRSRFLAPTFLLYHIPFRLSRGFWKVFWIFFGVSRGSLATRMWSVSILCLLVSRSSQGGLSDPVLCFSLSSLRQLAYYITSFSFCQEVFEKFFRFFSKNPIKNRRRPSVFGQPTHYTTYRFICQGLFFTFFIFRTSPSHAESSI